ncbi:hypothetical protein HispidOSU_013416, partial [Sigmodon hispidus]
LQHCEGLVSFLPVCITVQISVATVYLVPVAFIYEYPTSKQIPLKENRRDTPVRTVVLEEKECGVRASEKNKLDHRSRAEEEAEGASAQ